MKGINQLRQWATPITIGAFVLSAVTGVMLFFKVQLGLVREVHEWLSWLLVVGTIFHVIVNRHAFMKYFSKTPGNIILLFFLILVCLTLLPLGTEKGGHPQARIADALIRSPLSVIAKVANHEPDEVLTILRARGIAAESKDQTIQEIAQKNNEHPFRVLGIIF